MGKAKESEADAFKEKESTGMINESVFMKILT